MPFAIKLELTKNNNQPSENLVRYYSQTIETLVDGAGLDQMVLLTNGEYPEEVDLSSTLVEAEKKLEELTINKKYKNIVSLKIVEFPET
jgi:hypothetical protein